LIQPLRAEFLGHVRDDHVAAMLGQLQRRAATQAAYKDHVF
jgi:hypothetical protein